VSFRDGIKKEFESRNYERILNKANLKRISTTLITFLYEDDLLIFRSSEALGLVCRRIEETDTEFVRIILRRLFWHLNDESGAYCRGAPVGIGEIGRNAKKAFEGFRNMTVSLLDNEEVELKFVIYAIGRAAESLRGAYFDPIEKLILFLKNENPEIRGYSAFALGELKAKNAINELEKLRDDVSQVEIYDGEIRKKRVNEIVEEAVNKIKFRIF